MKEGFFLISKNFFPEITQPFPLKWSIDLWISLQQLYLNVSTELKEYKWKHPF